MIILIHFIFIDLCMNLVLYTDISQYVETCASFCLLSFAAFPSAGVDTSGADVFGTVATREAQSHAVPKLFSNRRYSDDYIDYYFFQSMPNTTPVNGNLWVRFLRLVLYALAGSSRLTSGYAVLKGWYIKW